MNFSFLYTQFLPGVFPYIYDIFLVIFASKLFLDRKTPRLPLFFIFYLIIIVILIIIGFYRFNEIGKYFFSDLRIIVVIFIILNLPFQKYDLSAILKFFYVCLLLNLILIVIGFVDNSLYSSFVKFYHSGYIVESHSQSMGTNVSLSYVTSLQHRFTGFFLQPVASGIFFSILLFCIFYLWKINVLIFPHFLILSVMTLFCGYGSLSTVFQMSILLLIFYYFSIKKYFVFYLVVVIVIFTAILNVFDLEELLIFIDIFFMSGRYGNDSHFAGIFASIDLTFLDYLLGFNLESKGYFGKGLGDSGYVIKFITGGVFYLISYYSLIILIFRKIYTTKLRYDDFLVSILTFLFLCEFGTNAFSLPQASILIFFLIFIVHHIVLNHDIYRNHHIQKK